MLEKKTLFFLILVLFAASALEAQTGVTLSGTIFSETTKQPVDFATVILLEARVKAFADTDGSYRITAPEKGMYTLIIQSPGLRQFQTKINLGKDTERNFTLSSQVQQTGGIVVTGKRDIQKLSRHTMTVKELKEVPATFGDSINALTSLPGVIRMGNDLFGPMVIRGGNFLGTNYFIDDIPMYDPLHYGGLHSVINSNFMEKIDLYSSSFPARFGNATSAVINITTLDSMKELDGYVEVAAITSSLLIGTPILRNKLTGGLMLDYPTRGDKDQYEEAGYVIASGRRGYIDLIAIPMAELITGKKINITPAYWDYQFKAKYNFNRAHSIAALVFGSSDYLKFLRNGNSSSSNGDDPLLAGLEFGLDKDSHSQGLYYTYKPSDKFQNKLILISALMHSKRYFIIPNEGVNEALRNYRVDSRPSIWGVKDRLSFNPIADVLDIYLGVDYNCYYFRATGSSLLSRSGGMFGNTDISDPDAYASIRLNETIINHTAGGFLEMKLTWGWLTFVPGIRSDYLARSGEVTCDPRGLISIEFPSGTTLSIAGGKYSYFFQVNPFLFDDEPQISKIGRELHSEQAIHRSAGIEQIIGTYSIKIEGFYNYFYNLAQPYYHIDEHGDSLAGLTTGRIRTYGVEVMLKRELPENENGLYGWISYTYTRSRFRSGLPDHAGLYGNPYNQVGDPYGSVWVNYPYEQQHSLKLILGLVLWNHTISSKFQLYSSFPYSPIIGSHPDSDYESTHPGQHREIPEYGTYYSQHYPMAHRLDLRYSYRHWYSWGYVTWYIEIINVYNYVPVSQQRWDYRYPYKRGENPKIESRSGSLGIIPNFGVELKF